MLRYISLIPILIFALLMDCAAEPRLDDLQTTNMSSVASASGYCSPTRTIQVNDVSTDGSVVVGKCAKTTSPNERQAFRYSKAAGFEILDGPVGKPIDQLKVSGNGLVIWGSYYVKDEGSYVFRLTNSVGVQHLGRMGKASIAIGGVSADGSVIAGSFRNSNSEHPMLYRPFRYSDTGGFEELGLLNGDSTHPLGVSADGSQLVGHVDIGTHSDQTIRFISAHAFSYSSVNGMKDVGALRDGHHAFATGVSNDGTVVGGVGRLTIGFVVSIYEDSYGFIQMGSGQFQKLSQIGGAPSVIRISGDGTRVAGSYVDTKRNRHVFTAKLVMH